MANDNIVELEFLRKERIILELIKNTSMCCLVWKQTSQPGQYTTETNSSVTLLGDQAFEFYISLINSGVYLDIIVDLKRLTTYDSASFPSLLRLYETIVGIEQNKLNEIKEAVAAFRKVPRVCGIFYTDYTRGGVLAGGGTDVVFVNEPREGGVLAGGHAPYNQEADATGGAVVSGEAKVQPYIEYPEGGVAISGEASEYLIAQARGGIVSGGNAVVELTIPTSGGINVGGSVDVKKISEIIALGGAVTGFDRYLWISKSPVSSTETTLNYLSSTSTTLNEFSNTINLRNIALDTNNKNLYWSDGFSIHKVSQLDESDDSIIYNFIYGGSFSVDYDGGILAFQDGNRIVVADMNGTVIDSFVYFGALHSVAVDSTNNLIITAQNLGAGFGGPKIIKYDLSTLTEISNYNITFPTTTDRLVLDRDSQLIFYGFAGGAEQANIRIRKLNYNFTSESIINPGSSWSGGPIQGGTWDFYADQFTKELIVWYRDTLITGNNIVAKMDYDGSNETNIIPHVATTNTFSSWIRVNTPREIETAIIEYIPA